MFNKDFDRRVHLTVGTVFLSTVIGVSFCLYALWPANAEKGYAPPQPISYSHKLHAGDLQIECLYCHTNAETHAHANIPSVRKCMNCHNEVQPVDSRGSIKPDVWFIMQKYKNNEPIEWVNVHNMADFVFFDHSRHVQSDLECQECHGPVETMDRVQRWSAMKMGWCLECHRRPPEQTAAELVAAANTVERDESNESNKQPLPYHTDFQGPTDCYTCHR